MLPERGAAVKDEPATHSHDHCERDHKGEKYTTASMVGG